jgi:hypothetical protein
MKDSAREAFSLKTISCVLLITLIQHLRLGVFHNLGPEFIPHVEVQGYGRYQNKHSKDQESVKHNPHPVERRQYSKQHKNQRQKNPHQTQLEQDGVPTPVTRAHIT